MKRILTLIFNIFLVCAVSAQTNEEARLERVNNLLIKINEEAKLREARVQEYLDKNKEAKRIVYLSDGQLMYLNDIVNGHPEYLISDNEGAAITVGADDLQVGGGLGLGLTGKGIRVGVWDGGYARDMHQEFTGRLLTGDGNEFGVSNHATHVMGTILANGVNSRAMGMATEATGISFGFSNDLTEMTTFATTETDGLILSNHSYGIGAGWRNDNGWQWFGDPSISETEDYRFGFYDQRAAQWDELAHTAPYYTIVKSSGNHRSDLGDGTRPPDGPYDIVTTFGTAKNIITVGAINKINGGYTSVNDVQISSFSSWGPTDDGRVKPDIVAAGVSILSSFSGGDEAYGNLQGTSMSTPNTTGSLVLLQELHGRLNGGQIMRAATLKSLILHTANEAGPTGPDYIYGWGVLAAERAAKVLLEQNNMNKVVRELTLNDGGTYELDIQAKAGTEVKATIVWTDLPGTPVAPALDPTDLMLVNDLDMRITGGGEEYQPWILDPATPGSPATRGDNFRDNVEQVVLESDGTPLTLTINHKGSIQGGSQEFSLILTYTMESEPATYYWVGASGGDWNDGANWSLTSGGEPANVTPGAEDIVFFDENSFDGGEPTVSSQSDVEVTSLFWLASEATSLNFVGSTLSVSGDIIFGNSNITLPEMTIILKEGTLGEHRIVSNGADLSNVTLQVASNSTNWEMSGDLSFKALQISSGTLNASNINLTVDELSITGGESIDLDLTNSTVEVKSTVNISAELLTMTTTGSTFNITGNSVSWNSDGLNMDGDMVVSGNMDLTGTGNVFSNFVVQDAGSFGLGEDVSIATLTLLEGSTLRFSAEKRLTITDNMAATGTSEKMISMTTDENEGRKV